MDTLVAYDDVKIGTLAFLLGSSFHIFRLCKFQELLGWWCGSSVECLLTSAKPQIHPQYCKKKKKSWPCVVRMPVVPALRMVKAGRSQVHNLP
jgi:hypothetical protein